MTVRLQLDGAACLQLTTSVHLILEYTVHLRLARTVRLILAHSVRLILAGAACLRLNQPARLMTGSECTFMTGSECVIVRSDVFTTIHPNAGETIQLFPDGIKGYSVNGLDSETNKKVIVADGILSEIISQKGNFYKVKNHGKEVTSWLIKYGDYYSHGETLKEAQESFVYKISNRDVSDYDNLTHRSILTKDDAIKAYMCITGACAQGTRYFVENTENVKNEYSVKEIIELTKGQYGNDKFSQFFIKEKQEC